MISDCCSIKKEDNLSLLPLYIVLWGVFFTSIFLTKFLWNNTFMMNLMWIWLLCFWVLKFVDLHGFAKSFSLYDMIAKRFSFYGYIFPFIEILLGGVYIFDTSMKYMFSANIVVGIISILWIISAYMVIYSWKKIECACMGTFWKLPMTKVTIIENLAMLLMVLYMSFWWAYMGAMNMADGDMTMPSDNLHIWVDTDTVDESQILESEMVTPPTTQDADNAMREHCKGMPKMKGCEKYR